MHPTERLEKSTWTTFVQSSIDNAENEEELDTEVKIFQNALDFSNIKKSATVSFRVPKWWLLI